MVEILSFSLELGLRLSDWFQRPNNLDRWRASRRRSAHNHELLSAVASC